MPKSAPRLTTTTKVARNQRKGKGHASSDPIRRRYALTNSFSGVAGEVVVAGAILRAGFRVAMPYWNDDYCDLLLLLGDSLDLLPIPIQVKSVQGRGNQREVAIQGLKKKYVERQPALCLAIYSPANDRIWFVSGAENIKRVHAEGVRNSRGKKGRNRKAYEDLAAGDDVAIYVDVKDTSGSSDFDRAWLLDRTSPDRFTDQIYNLVSQISDQRQIVERVASVLRKFQVNV